MTWQRNTPDTGTENENAHNAECKSLKRKRSYASTIGPDQTEATAENAILRSLMNTPTDKKSWSREYLIAIRHALSLRQDEFAKAITTETIKISLRQVQSWEQGYRVPPKKVIQYLRLFGRELLSRLRNI